MKLFEPLCIDLIGRRKDDYGWRSLQPSLDIDRIQSVGLVCLADKLGDAIVISLVIEALRHSRPDLPIDVVTKPGYADYWASHPEVRDTIIVQKSTSIFRSISKNLTHWFLGRKIRGRFEVAISFKAFNRADHFSFIQGLATKTNVGFNKLQYRLFDYSIDERCHVIDCQPIAARVTSVMALFGISVAPEELRPHLPYSPEDQDAARKLIGGKRPRMLLNVYAAGKNRTLSPASTVRCIAEIRRAGFTGAIFVSAPEGQVEDYESALSKEQCRSTVEIFGPQKELGKLFALVAEMDYVISPDTAVGHIAAGFGKPQITLFSRGGNFPKVWGPSNPNGRIVVSEVAEDVNGVNWDEFRVALSAILPLPVRI